MVLLLQYDIKSLVSYMCCEENRKKERESQRDGDRESTCTLQSSEVSGAQLSLVLYDFSPFAIDYNLV